MLSWLIGLCSWWIKVPILKVQVEKLASVIWCKTQVGTWLCLSGIDWKVVRCLEGRGFKIRGWHQTRRVISEAEKVIFNEGLWKIPKGFEKTSGSVLVRERGIWLFGDKQDHLWLLQEFILMLCVVFFLFHLMHTFIFYVILYTHKHCVSYSVNTWFTINLWKLSIMNPL